MQFPMFPVRPLRPASAPLMCDRSLPAAHGDWNNEMSSHLCWDELSSGEASSCCWLMRSHQKLEKVVRSAVACCDDYDNDFRCTLVELISTGPLQQVAPLKVCSLCLATRDFASRKCLYKTSSLASSKLRKNCQSISFEWLNSGHLFRIQVCPIEAKLDIAGFLWAIHLRVDLCFWGGNKAEQLTLNEHFSFTWTSSSMPLSHLSSVGSRNRGQVNRQFCVVLVPLHLLLAFRGGKLEAAPNRLQMLEWGSLKNWEGIFLLLDRFVVATKDESCVWNAYF